MRENEKIDFSALDPRRDRPRWERMVTSVTERALARRPRAGSVSLQVLAWRRPILALAAGLALVVGTAALLARTDSAQPTEPAYQLSQWAAKEEMPSPSKILEVIGGAHEKR